MKGVVMMGSAGVFFLMELVIYGYSKKEKDSSRIDPPREDKPKERGSPRLDILHADKPKASAVSSASTISVIIQPVQLNLPDQIQIPGYSKPIPLTTLKKPPVLGNNQFTIYLTIHGRIMVAIHEPEGLPKQYVIGEIQSKSFYPYLKAQTGFLQDLKDKRPTFKAHDSEFTMEYDENRQSD